MTNIFSKKLSQLTAVSIFLMLVAPALPAAAAGVTYAADTDLPLSGLSVPLKIMAGSEADSLTTTSDSFTVTVAAGEAFIVRYPAPGALALENDALLAVCNILPSKDNQLLINGPRTVTVTPSTTPCSTADYLINRTPFISITQPSAGASLASGQAFTVFWETSGGTVSTVRIRLSTDGGQTYPTVIADNLINNGYYQWTVPTLTTTDQARLRIDGLDSNGYVAIAVSPANFHIEGTPPVPGQPPAPTTPSYDYDPSAATTAAATIDVDRQFAAAPGAPAAKCPDGLRIKAPSSPAVYFCGADGKRHAFPNQKIHDSWYAGNFAGVYEVSDTVLASIQLGANVTYRPGVRMVKIQTDPKVYAVAAHGVLRWVSSEAVAQALYGADWNQKIDDVPDSFFADYQIGAPIQ